LPTVTFPVSVLLTAARARTSRILESHKKESHKVSSVRALVDLAIREKKGVEGNIIFTREAINHADDTEAIVLLPMVYHISSDVYTYLIMAHKKDRILQVAVAWFEILWKLDDEQAIAAMNPCFRLKGKGKSLSRDPNHWHNPLTVVVLAWRVEVGSLVLGNWDSLLHRVA
jgi:hypothetical protein